MQSSQIPAKLQLAFAANASGSYKRTVPVTSQIGISDGAASFNDGFPPMTFLNPSAGGALVDGRDVNGVLNQLSQLLVWLSAGGTMNYDAALQTAIGGYPKGAVIQSATTPLLFWMCTTENNMTDPDAGGAGWTPAYTPPPGTVMALAGSTIPSGYLAVPTTQTLVSTNTYPNLFDALGYAWGGSGTSFGLPYLASGYVPIQGTVGALSHGVVLAHTHQVYANAVGIYSYASAGGLSTPQYITTVNQSPAGGSDNLAAGRGHKFIVKY